MPAIEGGAEPIFAEKVVRTRAVSYIFTLMQRLKVAFSRSRGVAETVDDLQGSGVLDEPRATIADAMRAVPPAPGEARGGWQLTWMTAAGLFRLAVFTATTAADRVVASRIGAGLALLATIVCCAASCAARALN